VPRPLTSHETAILRTLLNADFPGSAALLGQLPSATVVPLDQAGSLRFEVGHSATADVVRRIPVEAETDDADGMTVHLLLHVVGGVIDELEIYREDSKPLQGTIRPGSLRILVL
jgi:uncharacterized protein DUF6984